MTSLITAELTKLGVSPSDASAIADDIAQGDARSLWHALLLRGLWSTVIDETNPTSLNQLGGPAVQRLLECGVDPHDLLDVVRETQVDTLYNVAQLLDAPAEGTELDEALATQLSVRLQEHDGDALPIYTLHSSLMEQDPSGRHGEARSLEMRQLQQLPQEEQHQLTELIRGRKFSAAAMRWKAHQGGELRACLDAVQALATQLR